MNKMNKINVQELHKGQGKEQAVQIENGRTAGSDSASTGGDSSVWTAKRVEDLDMLQGRCKKGSGSLSFWRFWKANAHSETLVTGRI